MLLWVSGCRVSEEVDSILPKPPMGCEDERDELGMISVLASFVEFAAAGGVGVGWGDVLGDEIMGEWSGDADVDVGSVGWAVGDDVKDRLPLSALAVGIVELGDRVICLCGVSMIFEPLGEGAGNVVVTSGSLGAAPAGGAVVGMGIEWCVACRDSFMVLAEVACGMDGNPKAKFECDNVLWGGEVALTFGYWVEPGAVAWALCVVEDSAVEVGGVAAEIVGLVLVNQRCECALLVAVWVAGPSGPGGLGVIFWEVVFDAVVCVFDTLGCLLVYTVEVAIATDVLACWLLDVG